MRAITIHAPHDLRVGPSALDAPSPGLGEVRISMAAGGICGSDLHYYHAGGFGTVRIREPMVLGHEASGFIEALGAGVAHLRVGDLVTVNPSQPCGACAYCQAGQAQHCENMIFNGSAMRFPHVQGLFRSAVTIPAERALVMPSAVSPQEAALCEPFAVALHAVRQAGDLKGRTVLVSGCGPIGILVIVAAKLAGAARIIATDLTAHSLDVARHFGATDAVNVAQPDALAPFAVGRGTMDVVIECSGAPAAAISAISLVKPRGRIVLVGLGGESPLPLNSIVAKEIEIRGTFRFHLEFAEAARLIGSRQVVLDALISAVYPMARAEEAFTHASDRTRATKVAIDLTGGLS